MNNKALIFSLCLSLMLFSSCQPRTNFKKVKFDYVEQGQLIEINGKSLYDLTITNKKNLAVLFSVDGCADCNYAKEQLQGYAKTKHCNVFTINFSLIDEENYRYIVDATSYANDAYKIPDYGEELSLPLVYLFAYQGVVISFNEKFVDYLLKYTEVSNI